jgi:hypothetical protein
MQPFARSWAGRYRKYYLDEIERYQTKHQMSDDVYTVQAANLWISPELCQMEDTLCVLYKLVEVTPYQRQVLHCVDCQHARLPEHSDGIMGMLEASLLGKLTCACGQDTASNTPCFKAVRNIGRALKPTESSPDGCEGGNG